MIATFNLKIGIIRQKNAARALPTDGLDVWQELTKSNPKDYAEVAFKHGITDLRGN